MNCSLNLIVFVDGLDIWDLPLQRHWHIDHLVTVMNLRNHLIGLLPGFRRDSSPD